MTHKQRSQMSRYLTTLANAMGLKDWRVAFSEEAPESESADANIRCVFGQKTAIVRVCEDFLDFPIHKQRETLAHELIHPHLDPIERAWMALDGQVHRDVYAVMEKQFEVAIEHATEALARVISPHLPLPPWAATKK